MPSGTIKIGQSEYDVRTNGSPHTVEGLANIPIKQVNGTTIYLRDVASVSDGFQVQTNIVRQDGGSAFAEHQETVKGSIEPGKLADLVVLSDDIFTIPPEAI